MHWDKICDFGVVECTYENIPEILIVIPFIVRDEMKHEENAIFLFSLSIIP